MKKQAGFTLVEIAIVLVIIGLLLGGVLKGQELIESAKVKSIAQDFRSISVAVLTYQDRFRAMPGDDKGATRWANACTPKTAANGDGIIGGKVDDVAPNTEASCVWNHLRQANLITGGVDVMTPPKHADAGNFGVVTGSSTSPLAVTGTLVVCAINVRGSHVIPLDAMLDDGNQDTGSMRAVKTPATAGSLPTTASSTASPDSNSAYTACMGF